MNAIRPHNLVSTVLYNLTLTPPAFRALSFTLQFRLWALISTHSPSLPQHFILPISTPKPLTFSLKPFKLSSFECSSSRMNLLTTPVRTWPLPIVPSSFLQQIIILLMWHAWHTTSLCPSYLPVTCQLLEFEAHGSINGLILCSYQEQTRTNWYKLERECVQSTKWKTSLESELSNKGIELHLRSKSTLTPVGNQVERGPVSV